MPKTESRFLTIEMKGKLKEINSFCEAVGELSNKFKIEVDFPPTTSRCMKCGGLLEKKKFVNAWDGQGKPTDVSDDLYCAQCGSRYVWPPEEADPKDILENWNPQDHKFTGGIRQTSART